VSAERTQSGIIVPSTRSGMEADTDIIESKRRKFFDALDRIDRELSRTFPDSDRARELRRERDRIIRQASRDIADALDQDACII